MRYTREGAISSPDPLSAGIWSQMFTIRSKHACTKNWRIISNLEVVTTVNTQWDLVWYGEKGRMR